MLAVTNVRWGQSAVRGQEGQWEGRRRRVDGHGHGRPHDERKRTYEGVVRKKSFFKSHTALLGRCGCPTSYENRIPTSSCRTLTGSMKENRQESSLLGLSVAGSVSHEKCPVMRKKVKQGRLQKGGDHTFVFCLLTLQWLETARGDD